MIITDATTTRTEPTDRDALHIAADGSARPILDAILDESMLAVHVNGRPLFRIACLADGDLPALVVGRLITEGLVAGASDIAEVRIAEDPLRADIALADPDARIELSSGFEDVPTHGASGREPIALRGTAPLEPVVPIPWSIERIFELARVFDADSPSHAATYAAHSCYLATADDVLCCCEDLGRHNAFDKAVGRGVIDGADLAQCIIFTSGRIPTDMAGKAIRAHIPVLVSKAVPTGKTIELARCYDLTLICSAHPDSIKVFNDPAW